MDEDRFFIDCGDSSLTLYSPPFFLYVALLFVLPYIVSSCFCFLYRSLSPSPSFMNLSVYKYIMFSQLVRL